VATCHTPRVGQHVYRHCKPQTPGTIIALLGKTASGYWENVRIRWMNGIVSEHSNGELKDFEALIAEHKKKAEGHEKNLAKLIAQEGQ
jgi:hypothetical protein